MSDLISDPSPPQNMNCVHGRQRSICAICAPAADAEYAAANNSSETLSTEPMIKIDPRSPSVRTTEQIRDHWAAEGTAQPNGSASGLSSSAEPAPPTGKFRKKPVVIDAVQWFAHGDDPDVVQQGLTEWQTKHRDCCVNRACPECGRDIEQHGWIGTLEGGHRVCPGDWLITDVKGERYPCKPDIFAATYDAA